MTIAAGEQTPDEAQALWDEVAAERESEATPSHSDAQDVDLGPPAEAPAEPAPEAETAPLKQEEQKPDDPYAGLHPTIRAQLERTAALEAQVTAQADQLKAAVGRIGRLQSEHDAARAAANKVGAQAAPTAAQIADAQKTPAKWEAMKADFPEWAEAIEEKLTHQIAGVPQQPAFDPALIEAEVQKRVADVQAATDKQIEAARNQIRAEMRAEAMCDRAHPTWRDDINTPDFAAWLQLQPPETKALTESKHGHDAVKLLDQYAAAKAKPAAEVKAERASRLQAAVTTRPGHTPPRKTVDEMTDDELWGYYAHKRESRRS